MNSIVLVIGLALVATGLLLFLVPERAWRLLPLPTPLRDAQPSTAALALFTGVTVVGAGLVLMGSIATVRGQASKNWTATPATILETSLERSVEARSGRTQWRPTLRFRYEVAGRSYEGTRLSFGLSSFPDASGGADAVIARYAPGTVHSVYVDPADPAQSVLVNGMDVMMPFFAGLGLLFVAVGALQLRMLKREWNPPEPEFGAPE